MTVGFLTLGCKVNQYETQAMAAEFQRQGFSIVDFSQQADVYVVNTCSVTAVSDKKSRQALRRCRRQNPQALVVAVGCYSQLNPEKAASLGGADLVLGSSGKGQVVTLVREALAQRPQTLCRVGEIMEQTAFEPLSVSDSFEHTRAYVKIQDGCDNYCSYCIIPYARGHARSRAWEEILEEFSQLAERGYQEAVLTGIEISTYRDGGVDLPDLLEKLDRQGAIPRIRLGSLETEETAQRLAALPHLCPQFHLALQSGCDTVLQRMNRKYTTAQYVKAVSLLQAIPHAAFTTDIIVGFPGETESEFEQTLQLVSSLPFLKIHIFPYSRRLGTPAARMENQIPHELQAERCKRLEVLAQEFRRDYLNRQVGRQFPVLLERECAPGMLEGYTPNYIPVTVPADARLAGTIVPVRLTGLQGDGCLGTL